ncbi:hypothetical protein JCM3765_000049 [Sporobolomyces pararoseus]
MEQLQGSTTRPVPLKLPLSDSSTSSNFPPLAFAFTFYASTGSSIASYFYSEEPTRRTTTRTIEFDEEVWGNERPIQEDEEKSVIEEDQIDEFIKSAIKEGETAGEALRTRNENEREEDSETGRKRKRKHSWDGDDDYASIRNCGSLKKKRSTESKSEEEESRSGSPKQQFTSRRIPLPAQSAFHHLPTPRSLRISIHSFARSLSETSYLPYLSAEPVPPSISDEYGATLIRFFRWVESPRHWDNQSDSRVFEARNLPPLSLQARKYLPDFEAIRKNHPLQRLLFQDSTSREETVVGNTKLCFEIAEWMWNETVEKPHLRWIVELAPIALFALLIEHVEIRRYLQAVRHAQTRFIKYLSTSIESTLSSRARRAKILVEWLERGGSQRWENFFTSARGRNSETGKVKEEPWEWWFYDLDDVGAERERRVAELDEWESREE